MVEIMLTRSRIQACFSGREMLTFVPLASIPAVQAREGAVNNTIIIFTLRQYDKIRCEFIILIRNCDSYCIFTMKVTDIYIERDFVNENKANAKVVKYVFGK